MSGPIGEQQRPLAEGRPVQVVVRRMGIRAASSLEARRLADAIQPALERAFAHAGDSGSVRPRPSDLPADRVAREIVAAVTVRLAEQTR